MIWTLTRKYKIMLPFDLIQYDYTTVGHHKCKWEKDFFNHRARKCRYSLQTI